MGRGKSAEHVRLILTAQDIFTEIQPASVRAVCYQLFNRKLIASMGKNDTNRVSAQLRDAREAGVIPWEWIVDDTRAAESVSAWDDVDSYLETMKRSYRRDRWTSQPHRVEVWSEKGTVRGTLAPVLDAYGVTFRVLHGYGSSTVLHDVAESSLRGNLLTVLYVGDWDPSGLHTSEVDLPNRIARYGGLATFERVALTNQHVRDRVLPSFSAGEKRRDARFAWYVERYGRRCWELDALSPILGTPFRFEPDGKRYRFSAEDTRGRLIGGLVAGSTFCGVPNASQLEPDYRMVALVGRTPLRVLRRRSATIPSGGVRRPQRAERSPAP